MSILVVLLFLLGLTHGELVDVSPMPSGFEGQHFGIGSWYQADITRDSTNGRSWCGYDYTDSSPVFAPLLTTMGGATYTSDPDAWKQQTETWCGLEANVTNPKSGKTMMLYIGDAL